MQVLMKRLLAHVSTKDELAQYLASKTIEKERQNGLQVVLHEAVSVGQHTRIWRTSIATKREQILKSCYTQ